MNYDGIPLAIDIYFGNKNEYPTLNPLEKKIIKDYVLDQIIVCTNAGLSSKRQGAKSLKQLISTVENINNVPKSE